MTPSKPAKIAHARPAKIAHARPAEAPHAKPAEEPPSRPAKIAHARPAEEPPSKPAKIAHARPAEATPSRAAKIAVARPAEATPSKPAKVPLARPSEATPSRPAEVTELHTRLLRLGLVVEESRSYWSQVDPQVPQAQRVEQAFSQRWFGSRSLTRVRYLVLNLDHRFLAWPEALQALRRWTPEDPATRSLVCHWHVQLSDPLYREFTGTHLAARRAHPEPTADVDGVVRWLNQRLGDRWAPATTRRMASGLLSTAAEAGLCSPGPTGTRAVLRPAVPDEALAYLLYLLRGTSVQGTLLENPYLLSVGLEPETLEPRLRKGLPGLGYRRTGDGRELDWEAASLPAWVEGRSR